MKRLLGVLAGLTLAACGKSNECRLDEAEGCSRGLVCEQVEGQETGRCYAPVQLQGKVFDLETKQALAGAEVTALDENGSPAADVAVTDAQGNYTLRVPSVRTDEQGAFVGRKVTLRAAAADHSPFPEGIRPSLPIDTAGAVKGEEEEAPSVVKSALTDVGLSPLPADQKGLASISGALSPAPSAGALVVGEATVAGAPRAVSAVVDRSGAFTLFNVPAGSWTVSAYGKGAAYAPATVDVAAEDVKNVSLQAQEGGLSTVTGNVAIVSGSGATSVVMVVESTFNQALARGEVPPGLRAPAPGQAANITGAFSIEGVPAGRYVVLAGFENDGLVRDPDPNIAGTTIQHITVSGATVAVPETFKVTDAITLVGPGAGEGLETTSATPTFQWAPYSSAKTYDLTVLDALGQPVWSQPGLVANTGGTNQLVYAGPALTPGGIYQWRLVAKGQAGNPISMSEDLKGLFQVQAP